METKFTEQESLSIISEMIDRAQNNVQKGSGTSMIFWGFTISIIAVLNLILNYTLPSNYSFLVWLLTIPAFFVDLYIRRKIDRDAIVTTHIDCIISSVWKGFTISCVIFLVSIFTIMYTTNIFTFSWIITPIILLLAGVSEYVTAKATRFRPFLYGAISMWAGSLVCILILLVSPNLIAFQFLVLAVCMIIGFLLPGIKMNKKAKKHV